MTIEQLFLQLGICGAMLLVWFRIEMRRIATNATTEDKKTEAMAEGFRSLSGKVDTHHDANQQAHAGQEQRLAAIETTLSLRVKTPARGVAAVETVRKTDGR